MTIRFILNGEDMEIDTEPTRRLINILREHTSLRSAKLGCLGGNCGVCLVLFNGIVAPSCLIYAFNLADSEIITLEGFSKTIEYRDITGGFKQAGVDSCSYCEAGKIFTAEMLLEQSLQPSKEAVTIAFRGIRCRCTDIETLYQGILAAGEARQRRIYGRF